MSQRYKMSTGSTNSRLAHNLAKRDLVDGDRKKDYFEYGARLYEASIQGDWKSANAILVEKPELVRYSLANNGETALHVAASANRSKHVVQFVKNLVDEMTNEDLELVNKNHKTAFYIAAAAGNLETVKIMLRKNRRLISIPGTGGMMMPLNAAAFSGSYEVVKYLYDNSSGLRDEDWTNKNRCLLLEKCVESDMFDIALDIVKMHPTLGRSSTILGVLARKPEAFLKTKSNIIMGTVYSVCAFIGFKVEIPETESDAMQLLRLIWEDIVKLSKKEIDNILRGPREPQKSDLSGRVAESILLQCIYEHLKKFETSFRYKHEVPDLETLISEHLLKMHLQTNHIIKQDEQAPHELKKLISEYLVNMHDVTRSIIRREAGKDVTQLKNFVSYRINRMRLQASSKDTLNKESYSSRVLFVAAEMGNTKFIVELIRRYPDLIWKVNDHNESIFHVAVKHRHEGIYNLLYEIGTMKDMITPLKNDNENNMLHLVGMIAKQKRLADVSGVALQVQRELLWFEEVKSMIPPSYREWKNREGLTPHELFAKEHKELVTQGENWMKGTANQCMVVATLIATIVFAAAFTVPGGYDQNDGIPMFNSKATFVVFVVADAISLLASSASILIFLSILTSRYAEQDFLTSIPNKLMAGLATLFISIATMTLAFGVSFFVLYTRGFLWIPILIGVLALLPVILYLCLQYGLFSDIIRSTYGSRYLFKTKKQVLYYENPKV